MLLSLNNSIMQKEAAKKSFTSIDISLENVNFKEDPCSSGQTWFIIIKNMSCEKQILRVSLV